MAKKKPNFEKLAHDLAGALQSLLWQAEQMKDMFSDEDNTIKDAIEEACDVLAKAGKAFGRKSA